LISLMQAAIAASRDPNIGSLISFGILLSDIFSSATGPMLLLQRRNRCSDVSQFTLLRSVDDREA
jgi:hypothetical protein